MARSRTRTDRGRAIAPRTSAKGEHILEPHAVLERPCADSQTPVQIRGGKEFLDGLAAILAQQVLAAREEKRGQMGISPETLAGFDSFPDS